MYVHDPWQTRETMAKKSFSFYFHTMLGNISPDSILFCRTHTLTFEQSCINARNGRETVDYNVLRMTNHMSEFGFTFIEAVITNSLFFKVERVNYYSF